MFSAVHVGMKPIFLVQSVDAGFFILVWKDEMRFHFHFRKAKLNDISLKGQIEKIGLPFFLELSPFSKDGILSFIRFGFDLEQLTVLLIDRGEISSAFGPRLALPGNLIYDNENLDMAANRVLDELTGLNNIYLEQVGAFGDPDRIHKESDREWLKTIRAEPEARVITVAYFSLVKISDYLPHASSFAKNAGWAPVNESANWLSTTLKFFKRQRID